jgi:hypothetical protein
MNQVKLSAFKSNQHKTNNPTISAFKPQKHTQHPRISEGEYDEHDNDLE